MKWIQKVGTRIFTIMEKKKKDLLDSGQCIAQNAGGGKFQFTPMYGA